MMILATLALYGVLFALVKIKVFKSWATWMTVTPIAFFVLGIIVFAIPMNWAAPEGPLVVYKNSVEITPMVSGTVVELPVRAGARVKKGDLLFQIDPGPYQAVLDNLSAQLGLATTRLEQAKQLAERKAGSVYEVQQFEAQVKGLKAQLKGAQMNLKRTTVRAPADGLVPDVALQIGATVSPSKAALPFIDESRQFLSVQISQGYLRHVKPGQEAEFLLSLHPGKVFQAKVVQIIEANPSGQLSASGLATATPQLEASPYWVVLEPVDKSLHIPAGAMGRAAIYTDHFPGMSHLFRRVTLRSGTWTNYLKP